MKNKNDLHAINGGGKLYACPHCGQVCGSPDWKARYHIWWSNQHGFRIRIFCKVCEAWTDITWSNKLNTVKSWRFVKLPVGQIGT